MKTNIPGRIYKGKLIAVEHLTTSALGINTFRLTFNTGSLLYQVSQKAQFSLKAGDFIYFEGSWILVNFREIFIIEKLVDESDLMALYHAEQEAEKYIRQ